MAITNWPALCIGLIVLFYWARVIKLVLKTKKQTGRAANFLPPELLGRILRVIWYPNVAAWVIVPIICSLHRVQTDGFYLTVTTNNTEVLHTFKKAPKAITPFWQLQPLEWVAVAVALVVLYLTMICWRKMGKDWRMGIDPSEKNTLIVNGPYEIVRHPIYALQCLLALASFVAVPVPAMAIVAAIQIILLQWEARREERHMLKVHPDQYGTYMRQVGRFIPRGRYHAPA